MFPAFARTSSTGSIDVVSSASSAQNTDCSLTTDDEDSDHKSTHTYKDRRREAHSKAEQKRRDSIKRGYEDLSNLVPTCLQQDTTSGYKLSKATILQRSIDFIQYVQQQKKKQDDELQSLRKEMVALQIMKTNYEEIVKLHQQTQPGQNPNQISEEVKFKVFQAICDNLFVSFESSVSVNSFEELSGFTFKWLEEQCKPQTLRKIVINILNQLQNENQ